MTSLWIQDLVEERKGGHSLARDFYTHPEIFALDIEKIYRRNWLYAGPTCKIPKPGDYFVYEIGDESIIVIRAKDGTVNALANVCRHRGSLICSEKSGHVKSLVCPYHAWAYDLDGKLVSAARMSCEFD